MTTSEKELLKIKYKACIFDLDGTLLDSMGVWKEVDKIFLGRRGLPFSEEYGKAISSMKLELAADYTVKLYKLEEDPKDIIKEWLELAKEAFAEHIQPKPYGIEFLKQLRERKIPAAIATTSQKELYMPALTRLGILDMFDAIADSEAANCGKDRPDIFLNAAAAVKTEPKDCIVFEDTISGIRSAREAGFMTVGFLDPSMPQVHEEITVEADYTAFDFKDFIIDM